MARVLLTNDDGVDAAGLQANVDAMRAAGHDTVVVAPTGNRSAMGHRVTVRERIELVPVLREPGLEIWSCSGTPADCVRMAFFADWIDPFDVVLSGINHGVNLGEDVFYSGTYAAAAEGAFLGLPAIAASQAGADADPGFLSEHPRSFPHAGYLAQVVNAMAEQRPPGAVLNFNFPKTLVDPEVRQCALGSRDWESSAIDAAEESGIYVVGHAWAVDPVPRDVPGTDFSLLPRGYATVTSLQVRGGMRNEPGIWAGLVEAGLSETIGGDGHG